MVRFCRTLWDHFENLELKLMGFSFFRYCKICLFLWELVLGGHEVLFNVKLSPIDVQPDEVAIVQFETRPLGDYWNKSVLWNNAYAMKYGHKYILIKNMKKTCQYADFILSPPWCKVPQIINRLIKH